MGDEMKKSIDSQCSWVDNLLIYHCVLFRIDNAGGQINKCRHYPTGRVEKEEVWEIPCQRRGNLLCCRIYLNFTPALLVGRGFVIAAECQMGPTGAISINLGMSSSDPTPINHTPESISLANLLKSPFHKSTVVQFFFGKAPDCEMANNARNPQK